MYIVYIHTYLYLVYMCLGTAYKYTNICLKSTSSLARTHPYIYTCNRLMFTRISLVGLGTSYMYKGIIFNSKKFQFHFFVASDPPAKSGPFQGYSDRSIASMDDLRGLSLSHQSPLHIECESEAQRYDGRDGYGLLRGTGTRIAYWREASALISTVHDRATLGRSFRFRHYRPAVTPNVLLLLVADVAY